MADPERVAIRVHGVVQGVGFRPFVFGLAERYRLSGFVRNRVGDVLIEVKGERAALDDFLGALTGRPPELARIDAVEAAAIAVREEAGFRIDESDLAAA